MKKLILTFTVLATLAATSCGTSVKKADDEGAVIKAKIENCTNPDSLKIYVQQAREYADKLVKAGDNEAAKAYIDEVKPAIVAKDPSNTTVFKCIAARADSAIMAGKNAVDTAAVKTSEAVQGAVEATKDKTKEVGEAVVDKSKEVGKAVADKSKEVGNAVVDKSKEVGNAVADKASDVGHAVADKTKEVLGK